MQVYSGWPQLVRILSSTTWYVAILGSWVEKEGIKSARALRSQGRNVSTGQVPPSPRPLQRTGLQSSYLQTLKQSL